MDIASVLGLAIALIGIVLGQIIEGGHLGSLVQLTALLTVLAGTVGAVMLQTQRKVFIQALRMAHWAFFPPPSNLNESLDQLIEWANIARKDGVLVLESKLPSITDSFTRSGLQMLIDGFEPEKIREALDLELSIYDERQRNAARVWEAAGGYSPTIGILGAVLGLIHVMENMTEPSKLGAGIAVAFVSTIYGVGFANLVFLPISNKLKSVIRQEIVVREMMQDGLVGIASGENPRLIATRLQSYLG
ncbi:MAG: flagellar motor protein [Pseudomonadota bacterium]